MTHTELFAKWESRLAEWSGLAIIVNGEAIAREVLADLRAANDVAAIRTMTPTEAAAITHYHPESICRLVRTGKVKNYGTKNRPRVRLDELPHKAPPSSRNGEMPVRSPRRPVAGSINSIARDAVASRIGRS